MKHKGSKWAKQVDWVGQLTNPIVKCYKLHNPKSQRSSDVHLRAVARPILPSPRKPQVFPTKLSPRFRKRSFTWDTKKNSDKSLKAQWRMYTALCKFASSSFLIFYLSSPWVIATMKIVNMEQWKFYHLLLLPGTSAHIIFGQTP